MECEEDGAVVTAVASNRGVKRKRGIGGARCLQLARAPVLPSASNHRRLRTPAHSACTPKTPREAPRSPIFPSPLLNVNLMEEITFWVCTRRAPCLYGYNNVYKKKLEEAHCSKYRNSSEPSFIDEVPSPKKKKRKLRLLDDESVSSDKHQNVYFEKSHKQYQRSWYSSDKSESNRSDIDFNIRNSCFRNKSKPFKSQRKSRTTPLKKNKIITSTPKPTTLRRSLRKSQQNLHSSQMDCSLEIFNSNTVNGEHKPAKRDNSDVKKKSGNGDHTDNSRRGAILKEQSKNEIIANGQFEDMSDVSGFTANYIRSTKINSKTPRKVRNKASRNLVRESQQRLQKNESKIIVCVNKSVNTGLPTPVLNQSTDSSQNVINLVTVNNNNNEKSVQVNQSTSQLKFINSKIDQIKESDKDDTHNMNVSFQSKSSGVSRYPTRYRNNSKTIAQDLENSHKNSTPVKKKITRGMRELRSINQNEQPICLVSRTRSGKQIGVTHMDMEDSGCSKAQMDNVERTVTSTVIKNVASTANKTVEKKKRVTSAKCTTRAKKSDTREQELQRDSESDSIKKNMGDSASSLSPDKCSGRRTSDKRQSLKKESLRDKSGFAACFSDSEEDKPLIRRKFFC